MVQRALNRWVDSRVTVPVTSVYDQRTRDRMTAFQLSENVKPADGTMEQATLDALEPYFDAYGRWRYRTFRPPPAKTPADRKFEELLAAMQILSKETPGYQLGGGHGIPLGQVSPSQKLDCSSSTSKALEMAGDLGFEPTDYAWVSGKFATSYGEPGRGRYFTVYANAEHVFVRLHRSRWWRFDTSPHGDGGRGPKLRMLPRFTSGFRVRHWRGM
jgi:hypothetical protein